MSALAVVLKGSRSCGRCTGAAAIALSRRVTLRREDGMPLPLEAPPESHEDRKPRHRGILQIVRDLLPWVRTAITLYSLMEESDDSASSARREIAELAESAIKAILSLGN